MNDLVPKLDQFAHSLEVIFIFLSISQFVKLF